MIGYYVHHHGQGHVNRAVAVAAASDLPITGLSSLPRPHGWRGEWVQLDRDDRADAPRDTDSGGRLHWVPVHDAGLRARMGAIAGWISVARPAVMVVDVSVEVSVLARLHGVPVVTFALPGDRGDEAHTLGYDVADVVLAAWPDGVDGMVTGLSESTRAKVRRVGAIARFAPDGTAPAVLRRTVLLLFGAGGTTIERASIERARIETPGWHWTVLDGSRESWSEDPWSAIRSADVVVTHAGQNALAEVAAARRPAIVVPQPRPFDEQQMTARALRASGEYPVVVLETFPPSGWPELLESASALDGRRWRGWNDGSGAHRVAAVLGSYPAPADDAA